MAHKATARKVLEKAMANRRSAQEILALMDALIDAMQAMAAKMDLDTGIADTDYSDITDLLEKLPE